VKMLSALVLFFASLPVVHASTIQDWTYSATSFCWDPGCTTATLSLNMFTDLETGTFDENGNDEQFVGTFPVVTSLTGSLNGNPLTMVSGVGFPQDGTIRGWIFNGLPEEIEFSDGTFVYDFQWDLSDEILLGGSNLYHFGDILVDPVIPTPEPGVLVLLTIGFACLLGRRVVRKSWL